MTWITAGTIFALGAIAVGCDTESKGACVTHNSQRTPTVHFCNEDEEDYVCEGTGSYAQQFHEGSSCSAAGYPYYCTTTQMEKNGLSGASRYLSNSQCDPRVSAGGSSSGGSSGGSSSGGSSAQCGSAWTCANDGQATPMCQWACSYPSGSSQRSQTCKVLASMLESGNAGACCTVCR